MASRPKTKMPISERAKQFSPFSPLRGLEEALARKERMAAAKIELSDEAAGELDAKIRSIRKGMEVSLTFYCEDEYVQSTGKIFAIREEDRKLRIDDIWIRFEDILDIYELFEEQ